MQTILLNKPLLAKDWLSITRVSIYYLSQPRVKIHSLPYSPWVNVTVYSMQSYKAHIATYILYQVVQTTNNFATCIKQGAYGRLLQQNHIWVTGLLLFFEGNTTNVPPCVHLPTRLLQLCPLRSAFIHTTTLILGTTYCCSSNKRSQS